MTKFRDMGAGKKTAPKVIETSKGIVDFVPTFEENTVVKVKESALDYSKDLTRLGEHLLLVDYCKVADLNDMVIEVIYLKQNDLNIVQNPYLVEHFEKL